MELVDPRRQPARQLRCALTRTPRGRERSPVPRRPGGRRSTRSCCGASAAGRGGPARPPPRISKWSRSRSRSSCGENSFSRAAASSIASGRPSSRAQISATAAGLSSRQREPGRDLPGALDEQPHGLGLGEHACRGRRSASAGRLSGGTAKRRSPRTRSASRLVARTCSSGHRWSSSDDAVGRHRSPARGCRAPAAGASLERARTSSRVAGRRCASPTTRTTASNAASARERTRARRRRRRRRTSEHVRPPPAARDASSRCRRGR